MNKIVHSKRSLNLFISIAVAITSTSLMVLALANASSFLGNKSSPNIFCIFHMVTLFIAALRQLCYFFKNKNEGKEFRIYRLACVGVFSLLAILTISLIGNEPMVFASGIIYISSLIIYLILKIIHNHTVRNLAWNLLALGICISLLVSACLNIDNNIMVTYSMISTFAFVSVLRESFVKIKFTTLKKIFDKTYAVEILLGLVFLIVAFSFVFSVMEEISYGDALWYCFSVVTTIGFGDITVTNSFCRVLSVILGIYGIIVVALVTSIIVNFYNEVKVTTNVDKQNTSENKEDKDK